MSEYLLSDAPLKEWSAQQLADYLKTKGLGDYSELMIENNVTGSVAHRLTDNDLKEIGITKVGDRLKTMEALESLKKAKSQQDREKTLWEGKEVLYFSCWDRMCSSCCGCCPDDPSTYRLTSAHLEIKTVYPCRVGPIRCCCGHSYEIDNIDLSNISDADVRGVPPNCCHQLCCGETQEHVLLKTTNEGVKVLKLPKGEGQKVSRKIKNQVEVMQRMERN